MATDELTHHERVTAELATALMGTGDLRSLADVLRDGPDGPERARGALRVLGELDLNLLVQICLDSLLIE